MPRPTITVTWRIPAELHSRLREAAQQAGQSMNGLVVAALTKYLEQTKSGEEEHHGVLPRLS